MCLIIKIISAIVFRPLKGQTLVEILLAIALAALILPGIAAGIIAARSGTAQQKERFTGITLMEEAQNAVRSVREKGWEVFAVNGTYHPEISGSSWVLSPGAETFNGFTRQIVISDVNREDNVIVATGGAFDPSTKKVEITVSWNLPIPSTMTSTTYLTRYLDNLSFIQTTLAEFMSDTRVNVDVTDTDGGEVTLAINTKAKWCEPEFSSATIDLPDGPPVAVDAKSSTSSASIPNDAFVATAPSATSSVKFAYVNVSADTDPPVSTLRGTFTLDSGKYSNPALVPTGVNLDNNFRTNDIKYYKSPAGKTYALLAIDKPDKEVIALQVHDGGGDAYQDPENKIYKYWTFFNTKRYYYDSASQPDQDKAPFGYGATTLAVHGDRGYLSSGGYLYVFDLSNIDSKSAGSGLDMFGCRIQLDGYDCQPGSPGSARKYSSGQTGSSWADSTSPIHNDCSDGGNIELYATNDIAPVKVGSNTYVYVAVGGVTNPEFEIVNVTSVPSSSRSNDSSCGRISGGDSGWKRISTLDFNSQSNTEEAANSVYAKSDGSRAYISSNGGIDGNNNGQPDSKQFYVINTSNKSSPSFLSGSPGSPSYGPTSGYYYGTSPNDQLYPKRSLTVLNGERAILVGQDPTEDINDAQEYQVLNISSESSPNYCGGVNFDEGFNDLTSVSEADGDNYVYMVANTTVNELKIIQGGPDGTYLDTGTLESVTLDVGYSTAFNGFTATMTRPTNTDIKFQFASMNAVSGSCNSVDYSFIGPDGTPDTYYTATESAIFVGSGVSGYANPGRCFRYKAYFSTTDYNATPILNDMTVNYSP